jgi:hypothetical protein
MNQKHRSGIKDLSYCLRDVRAEIFQVQATSALDAGMKKRTQMSDTKCKSN